jgi:hypothetical protein
VVILLLIYFGKQKTTSPGALGHDAMGLEKEPDALELDFMEPGNDPDAMEFDAGPEVLCRKNDWWVTSRNKF